MSSRLQHHYLRLLSHFGQQPTQTHLDALAELLCCTRRHVRGLLEQMAALGWLSWQGAAGRGRRSSLQLLASEAQLRLVRAGALLEEGELDGAVAALGADGQQLVALLRSQLGQHQIQDRQLLRIPYYRRLGMLHPQRPCRRTEIHLLRQIFNGLTRINEENGELEPDLAHHWHSQDGRHWVFHLRPAVRWHDGRRLSAADLLASLTALRQLPLFCHLQAVSWASPHRLTLELAEADYRLPWLLAHHSALILPKEGVEPRPGQLPVGTGPYRVSRQDERCLRLSAFDDYFGLRALLDEVEIWQLPELDSQALAAALPSCSLTVELGRPAPEPSASQGSRELEQGGYFLLVGSRLAPGRHAGLAARTAGALQCQSDTGPGAGADGALLESGHQPAQSLVSGGRGPRAPALAGRLHPDPLPP
ncbi:MAG: SgrR family transcriptional regulator [Aeromonadaceae bacterium]|nr:SgrR family transcriptional regulator [Aeromonadaceae bacterium]